MNGVIRAVDRLKNSIRGTLRYFKCKKRHKRQKRLDAAISRVKIEDRELLCRLK